MTYEIKLKKPPVMKRSQGQLCNAYAPGAFFTFEGGRGACRIIESPNVHSSDIVSQRHYHVQIVKRLNEALRSWLERARTARGGREPDSLCIDESLLRNGQFVLPPFDSLVFVKPISVSYEPSPLAFVCSKCNLFEYFDSIKNFNKNNQRLHGNCLSHKGKCEWRQLDVIFVSHSSEVEPPQPGRYNWSQNSGEVQRWHNTCEYCYGEKFCLDTSSNQISKWFFYCANHKCFGQRNPKYWHQYSKFLTEHYGDKSSSHRNECRMIPLSYRASMVHYAQIERFVIVPESQEDLLNIINSSQHELMYEFLARRFRYPGNEYTDEEIEARLRQAGRGDAWEEYITLIETAETFNADEKTARTLLKLAQEMFDSFTKGDAPILESQYQLPDSLKLKVAKRDDFTGRFDPFILAVEHEALVQGKLKVASAGNKQMFVRFASMDNNLSPKDDKEKISQEKATKKLMDCMGINEIGLIREFDLCQFTYGYSRISSNPITEIGSETYPTKLRMFNRVKTDEGDRRPIYTVTQKNEAIYVRLDHNCVYEWLKCLNLSDLPDWDPDGIDIGGRILEVSQPFGRFFSELYPGPASTYRYIYTLLHTFSHVIMKGISESSGLDLSSLSEYIFPADLAFVVYRNGTTMDLGNLSTLWRNENNSFLESLLDPKMNRCNSGQLCPGACPDCITIPETSCIASNNLLSRSTLIGGIAPTFDTTNAKKRIPGYFETVLNVQR